MIGYDYDPQVHILTDTGPARYLRKELPEFGDTLVSYRHAQTNAWVLSLHNRTRGQLLDLDILQVDEDGRPYITRERVQEIIRTMRTLIPVAEKAQRLVRAKKAAKREEMRKNLENQARVKEAKDKVGAEVEKRFGPLAKERSDQAVNATLRGRKLPGEGG